MFVTRYGLRQLKLMLSRYLYFQKVAAKSHKQIAAYRKTNPTLSRQSKSLLLRRRELPIYLNCLPEINSQMDLPQKDSNFCSNSCAAKKAPKK